MTRDSRAGSRRTTNDKPPRTPQAVALGRRRSLAGWARALPFPNEHLASLRYPPLILAASARIPTLLYSPLLPSPPLTRPSPTSAPPFSTPQNSHNGASTTPCPFLPPVPLGARRPQHLLMPDCRRKPPSNARPTCALPRRRSARWASLRRLSSRSAPRRRARLAKSGSVCDHVS